MQDNEKFEQNDNFDNGIGENPSNDVFTETRTPDDVPKKKTIGREISEWIISIVIALVVASLLTNFVVLLAKVDGQSMLPTLEHNERLIVWRLGYTPQKGDIIILNPPVGRGPYVKRVIGTGGDTVRIDSSTGSVFVNGEKIDEPYINNQTTSSQQEYFVPEGHVFVMGDNRGNSNDSRNIGVIPNQNVIGKVVFRIWPLNKIGMP